MQRRWREGNCHRLASWCAAYLGGGTSYGALTDALSCCTGRAPSAQGGHSADPSLLYRGVPSEGGVMRPLGVFLYRDPPHVRSPRLRLLNALRRLLRREERAESLGYFAADADGSVTIRWDERGLVTWEPEMAGRDPIRAYDLTIEQEVRRGP